MKKEIILAFALCLMAIGCGEKKEKGAKAPTRVKTVVVSPAFVDNAQTYVGIVEENEGTAVSFTSMGVVKRMLVREGQAVGRGQLIAEMDDTQARNLLAGAEAQMTQANDALQRYSMLHDNGSLPEVQWVEIQSKVAQAQSQLEVAKKNLADCRLTAPVSGIIGQQQVKAGETALPSQAVVTILDISSVKVKVAVPEAEVDAISSTTPTTINVEAVGKQVNGGRIEKGVYGGECPFHDRRLAGHQREVAACDSGTEGSRRQSVCMDHRQGQYSPSRQGEHRRYERQQCGCHRGYRCGTACGHRGLSETE